MMSALYSSLWKHCAIRKKQIVLTCFEVIVPIVIMAFIVFARSVVPGFDKVYVNSTTKGPTFDELSLRSRLPIDELNIYYAPNNNFTEELIRRMQLKLDLMNHHITGFSNEKDLFNYYNTKDEGGTNIAILFDHSSNNIPKELNYNIKIYKDYVEWGTKELFSESFMYLPGTGSTNYIDHGFLPIQFALEVAFIELTTRTVLDTQFEFEEFPYPPHSADSGINEIFIKCLPLMIILSFLFICSSVLKNVVEEKAQGMKELMKINGLKTWPLFMGWFLNGFLINLVSIIFIVILLKCKLLNVEYAPIEHCHWFILFLLLSLYCSATISFLLVFSTFFTRATLASVLSIVAWLGGYITLTSIGHRALLKLGFKRLFALMPNVALYYAYDVIAAYELREVNLNLTNIYTTPTESAEDISMGGILMYLLFETIVYFLLATYLDQILPGPYGIPKPWHFLFSKDILKRSNSVSHVDVSDNSDSIEILKVDDGNVMIRVSNLTKEFANVTAVKKLNMDIYKGTVTSLLGRNGAGKTTTMSMMTGMINPTSGDVFIDGISTVKNPEQARKLMSICPQHDLLFKELTVWEHLILFGLLRGSSKKACELQAEDLLKNKLHLMHKQHELVSKLSGGMMRKVALGIALMGNPKLIILDEPTAGIDVEARREIWDLILTYKNTHTILLSTHFLEEADELSDRIAIMDRGTLVSYGTSMFLRNKYNVGYICTCTLTDETKVDGVTSVIKKYIPEANKLTRDDVMSTTTAKDVIQFVLPSNMKHKFYTLLSEIQCEKSKLGIKTIKFSNTTLEDVVLKVMSSNQPENNQNSNATSDVSKKHDGDVNIECVDEPDFAQYRAKFNDRNRDTTLVKQIYILIKKLCVLAKNHSIFLWKSRFYVSLMVLILFLFGAITMIASKVGHRSVSNDGTTLLLNLSPYGETKVFFSINGAVDHRLGDIYRDVIISVGSNPIPVSDAIESIATIGIENIAQYKRWFVVSTEFQLDNTKIEHVKVLYSNNAIHGAPISLNIATNTILKYLTGDDKYSISVSNTPLHAAKQSYIQVQESSSANMLLWFFFLPLGPLFAMSVTLMYPTYMQLNEINVLQKLCGVPVLLYWLVNYIVDFIFGTFGSLILVVLLLSVKFASFYHAVELLKILIIYCVCSIPFGYLFTRMKSVESAIFRYVTISVLLGVGFAGALLIAESVEASLIWINIFKSLVLFVPQASLTYLLGSFAVKVIEVHNWEIKTQQELVLSCQFNPMPCCEPESKECSDWKSAMAFSPDMIAGQLFISLVYFIIIICLDSGIESDYFWDMIYRRSFYNVNDKSNNDLQSISISPSNVKMNKKLVTHAFKSSNDNTDNPVFRSVSTHASMNDFNSPVQNLLEVHGISKKFLLKTWKPWKWRWIHPVNNLGFNVAKNQCFGLLGVNGAGKTTTFRILTNTIKPNGGTMDYKGDQSRLVMGYCPQKSALIEKFTVFELVENFANLSNAPIVKEDLSKLIKLCGLSAYENVPCETLSGGNKRKLSMAIAFVAIPELLLLDEPTTGVDLVARRELWRLIKMFTENSSVILTTHSMEECEALCDEIAVMKDGNIKAMGKVSDLKKEYCVGYMIKIEFQIVEAEIIKERQNDVLNELCTKFDLNSEKNVIEKERCFNTLQVQVKQSTWEDIFLFMEMLKERDQNKFGILDYFVKEVSFEDVFLTIASQCD